VLTAEENQAILRQAEGQFRLAIVADPNLTLAHDDLADLLRKEHRDGEAASETNVNPPSDFNDSNRPKIGRRIIVDGNTGQEITDVVEAKTATEIHDVPERSAPQAAPRFKFVSAKGEHVSLDDLRGKIVLLDFWASWCPPCRASVPELGEIYDEYPKDKFVLIGISLDENDRTWRQFTESHDEQWVQVRDSNRQLSRLFFSFGRMALPTYFLVDGEGNVRLHISGWSDSMGQRLDREIGRLIKELPASAAVEKPD
jgi:thiol-disulfide isomerase/thioredoxin